MINQCSKEVRHLSIFYNVQTDEITIGSLEQIMSNLDILFDQLLISLKDQCFWFLDSKENIFVTLGRVSLPNQQQQKQTFNNYIHLQLFEFMIEEKEDPKLISTYKGHKESVLSVAFHPLGKQVVSGSVDTMVCIWNIDGKGEMRKFLGHRDYVRDVKFSPKGDLIASASQDQTVRLWQNTPQGHSITLKPHQAGVRSVCFSSDGQLLLTGSDDKTLKVFKLGAEIKYQFSLIGHKQSVKRGVFSPDTRLIASGGDDSNTIVWDVQSQKIINVYSDHKMTVNDVKFSPDGTCLASCSRDRRIKIYDTRVKRQILSFDAHGDSIHQLDYHPNNNNLMSCAADSKIKIWDLKKGKLDYTLYAHQGIVTSAAFSKEGDYFVSGGEDAFVLLWKSNLDSLNNDKQPEVTVSKQKKNLSKGETIAKKQNLLSDNLMSSQRQKFSINPERPFTDEDIPPEVIEVVDKISHQLESIVNTLLTIQKRVALSQQKISKLNLVIYKKLQKVKTLHASVLSINGLKESNPLKETIRIVRQEEDAQEIYHDYVQI